MEKVLSVRHSFVLNERLGEALRRVCATVVPDSDQRLRERCRSAMLNGYFMPSGRTLKTANPSTKTITPNCSVIPMDLGLASRLLKRTTGVGMNLDCVRASCVVDTMRRLGDMPEDDGSGRRPGIMVALDWRHAGVEVFATSKAEKKFEPQLSNMNISVVVPPDEVSEFLRSKVADLVCRSAHACGDPGILFIRRGGATVPCGELWMLPGEVCSLGYLDVSRLWCATERRFDIKLFRDLVDVGVRFLDCGLDCMEFVDSSMRDATMANRRIGLGVMGYAKLLRKIGVAYESSESLALSNYIGKQMRAQAEETSAALRARKKTPRNKGLLAFPPNGGVASLVETSNSIEPYFEEANEISFGTHLRVLSAWQRHVDGAISKTVNLPNDATSSTIKEVYAMAAQLGCKGVTVFRNGCLEAQPVRCS